MSFVFGWRLLRLWLNWWQHSASTMLKKKNKIKIIYYVFVILCVFGGLVGYDERSRWDSFWDGIKYE